MSDEYDPAYDPDIWVRLGVRLNKGRWWFNVRREDRDAAKALLDKAFIDYEFTETLVAKPPKVDVKAKHLVWRLADLELALQGDLDSL